MSFPNFNVNNEGLQNEQKTQVFTLGQRLEPALVESKAVNLQHDNVGNWRPGIETAYDGTSFKDYAHPRPRRRPLSTPRQRLQSSSIDSDKVSFNADEIDYQPPLSRRQHEENPSIHESDGNGLYSLPQFPSKSQFFIPVEQTTSKPQRLQRDWRNYFRHYDDGNNKVITKVFDPLSIDSTTNDRFESKRINSRVKLHKRNYAYGETPNRKYGSFRAPVFLTEKSDGT